MQEKMGNEQFLRIWMKDDGYRHKKTVDGSEKEQFFCMYIK